MTTDKPWVWFFGGMWYHPSQTDILHQFSTKDNYHLESSYVGNSHKGLFETYVEERAKEINSWNKDAIFVAHSYGIRSAVAVAKKVKRLRGIIAIAPGPNKGIHLPPNPRLMKWQYLKAAISGGWFELTRGDEEFARGGAHCHLGEESGKILRYVICPKIYGFDVEPLAILTKPSGEALPSVLYTPTNDQLIPKVTGEQIAGYHEGPNVKVRPIQGGHFAHCESYGADKISQRIVECIEKW